MHAFPVVLVFGCCVAVFLSDVVSRRVPNVVIAAGLLGQAALIATSVSTPAPLTADFGRAALGLVFGLVFFVPFYAFRAMGAGDVKFFALLGFLLGPIALLPIWLFASVLAGIHALVKNSSMGLELAVVSARARQVMQRRAWFERAAGFIESSRRGRTGAPYAAYMALAAVGWIVWRS